MRHSESFRIFTVLRHKQETKRLRNIVLYSLINKVFILHQKYCAKLVSGRQILFIGIGSRWQKRNSGSLFLCHGSVVRPFVKYFGDNFFGWSKEPLLHLVAYIFGCRKWAYPSRTPVTRVDCLIFPTSCCLNHINEALTR